MSVICEYEPWNMVNRKTVLICKQSCIMCLYVSYRLSSSEKEFPVMHSKIIRLNRRAIVITELAFILTQFSNWVYHLCFILIQSSGILYALKHWQKKQSSTKLTEQMKFDICSYFKVSVNCYLKFWSFENF